MSLERKGGRKIRIIIIHPTQTFYNSGDGLTYKGVEYLIRRAFDDVEIVEFDMRRAEREIDTYVPEYNWGDDIDIIVVPGAPWISNSVGVKHRMLTQAKERWPGALKVAIGIGSFFSHMRMSNRRKYIFSDNEKVTGDIQSTVEPFRDFDLVIARDILAHKVLEYYDVKNELYYDPSIFTYFDLKEYKNKNTGKNILVYFDPLRHEQVDHLPRNHWDKVVDYQIAWSYQFGASNICVTSGDKASADSHDLSCRFVSDFKWVASQMSKAKFVLSGRVHQAILAKIMGCPDVSLIPVDSRYLTAKNVDINIMQPEGTHKFSWIPQGLNFELGKIQTYSKNIIGKIRRSYGGIRDDK